MTIMFKAKLAFSSFFFISLVFAQNVKLAEEKELEVLDFKSVKDVLAKDGLDKAVEKKKKQIDAMKVVQTSVDKDRYNYPNVDDMWGFLSEYWLVKNAPLLGWDFEKPEYGIEESFATILEKLGFYQKKYKILLLNTPVVVRGALPGANGENIFLLSVPFIKTLDLSKLEISLLLLEDFFRLEAGYFKKSVMTEKMGKLSGSNFIGHKPDLAFVEEIINNYGLHLREKGYSFQQQFEVTKKMDSFLKSNLELWNSYFRLLGKLDRFVKSNAAYKDYIKLYPSPEMQLKWLSPEEKIL